MGAIIATGRRTVKGWDVSLVRESAAKQATTEIVGEVRSARKVAHAALETRLVRQHVRLHGPSKTRKGQATRDRIMTAAGELMIEHGGTDFQMSEVSSRCRMSKGRNRVEETEGILTDVYPKLFTLYNNSTESTISFSYAEVLTHEVELEVVN